MPLFDACALPGTPWKNGGGVTRTLLSWPPGAGMVLHIDGAEKRTLNVPNEPYAFSGDSQLLASCPWGQGFRLVSDGPAAHDPQ
jgi:environmental stress-induced protein Ves